MGGIRVNPNVYSPSSLLDAIDKDKRKPIADYTCHNQPDTLAFHVAQYVKRGSFPSDTDPLEIV
jgi:hypothetical protein